MANYDSNYAIAQEISARIGNSPIPFDSVYSICLEIYNELGGEPAQFDSVYEILLGILPLVEGGIATKVIDDTSIRLDKTWSSSKINSEIEAHSGATYTAGQNISIDASNAISADGYVFDETKGSFATKYLNTDEDESYIATNTASGEGAFAEGYSTTATGMGNHAEGGLTQATGSQCAHAEGLMTVASGKNSHAEGNKSIASGQNSHAEGCKLSGQNPTTAAGNQSHAEGGSTLASGGNSHAEGEITVASGASSHAEGQRTVASGLGAHAEGCWYNDSYPDDLTTASGRGAHAEGAATKATANCAHSEGIKTTAQNETEHAEGSFNVSHKASTTYGNAGNTQHSVGINQKNAIEIMQNGDYYLYGVGSYQGTDTKVQDATVQTLQDVINGKADAYEVATLADIEALFVMPTFNIDSSLYKTYGNLNWAQWLNSKYNTANYTHIYNASSYDSSEEQIPEVDPSAYPVQNGQYYSTCEDTYVPATAPADDEIWYTTESGNLWEPYVDNGDEAENTLLRVNNGSATILSNNYVNGHGVIKYSEPITSLGYWFGKQDDPYGTGIDSTDLTTLTLPNSITFVDYILDATTPQLESIYYNGTVAECEEIDWDSYDAPSANGIDEIICLDGTYSLSSGGGSGSGGSGSGGSGNGN
jgi:hypothetical protein